MSIVNGELSIVNLPLTNCIRHDGGMCSVAPVHCSKMDIHVNIGTEIIDLRILDAVESLPQRHNKKSHAEDPWLSLEQESLGGKADEGNLLVCDKLKCRGVPAPSHAASHLSRSSPGAGLTRHAIGPSSVPIRSSAGPYGGEGSRGLSPEPGSQTEPH